MVDVAWSGARVQVREQGVGTSVSTLISEEAAPQKIVAVLGHSSTSVAMHHLRTPPETLGCPAMPRSITHTARYTRHAGMSRCTSSATLASAALRGHAQHLTGNPPRVTASPITTCGGAGRWSFAGRP
jgi:hypothetical protein